MLSRTPFVVALALALTLASAAVTSRARATGEDRAMALDLFEQGRALFKTGNYAAALTQFEAAGKVMRTFGILLNIAECQEKLGRTASAWATWREARAVALEAQRAEDESLAAEREKALEAGLSRLTIVVPPDVEPPDLEVRRDGAVVPREAWKRAIAVDPGTHVIEARAPGRKSRTLNVTVDGNGDSRSVTLTALEPEDTPRPAPPALSAPASATTTSRAPSSSDTRGGTGSGQRLAGWILGASGIAGVGAGIAVALAGQSQHNSAVATDLAGNLSQAQGMESDANRTKMVGYVTLGAGAAFLVSGLVLVLTAPSAASQGVSNPVAMTVSLKPWIFSAGGGGAAFSKEW